MKTKEKTTNTKENLFLILNQDRAKKFVYMAWYDYNAEKGDDLVAILKRACSQYDIDYKTFYEELNNN